MLSRRLIRRDFEVQCAGDGEQGVAKVRESCPALIMMDVSLPGMDGFEFVEYLREHHEELKLEW